MSNIIKKVRGIISINSLGSGYVAVDGVEEDIKVEAAMLNTALHKDEVEVFLLPKKPHEKQKGEVVGVIKRAKTRFVGVVQKSKKSKYGFLVADDQKMRQDIFLPNCQANTGDKVLVEITGWGDARKSPEGKVVMRIGKKGDNDAEINSIVIEKGLSVGFPKKVEKEAAELRKKKQTKEGRRDFTDRVTFTIDPHDAKDFDDAISVARTDDNLYEIGVHIADVSHYVKEGSLIDKEAKERAFSIYLVDRTIPMLPEVLSNDLCSLNPQQEKMAFSVVFKMNSVGKILEHWVEETVIVSKKRFSYEEAQKVLDNKNGALVEELMIAKQIAEELIKSRKLRGSLEIDSSELIFELDKDGVPLRVKKKESLFVHQMIEEFMVLANKIISENFNTLYRIHERPDRDLIKNLVSFLQGLGYAKNYSDKELTTIEINNLMQEVDEDKSFLVQKNVLRSMAKARYSTINKKHFGLALDKYTHFTSPIRRYADLLMHRIVKARLKGGQVLASSYEEVAQQISLRELDVLDAERSSIQYKQVEYMMSKINEEFDVIVAGVMDFGVFVQEVGTMAEGMVSVKDMNDDYYVLDEGNYTLIGTRKGKRYSLGDKVRAKLVRASLATRQLDFVFVR